MVKDMERERSFWKTHAGLEAFGEGGGGSKAKGDEVRGQKGKRTRRPATS